MKLPLVQIATACDCYSNRIATAMRSHIAQFVIIAWFWCFWMISLLQYGQNPTRWAKRAQEYGICYATAIATAMRSHYGRIAVAMPVTVTVKVRRVSVTVCGYSLQLSVNGYRFTVSRVTVGGLR